MLIQIKNRFTDSVIWEDEVTIRSDAGRSLQLGAAVKLAISQKADLQSADLQSANLQSANLQYANLQYANLQYANLQYANLQYANLQYANLQYANLQSADLQSANLQSANLRSANLQYANLQYANLQYADLQAADLGKQVSIVTKLVASVSRSDGYIFLGFIKEDRRLGIVAGCQNRVLSSYRQHVTEDYPARSGGGALAAETTDILDFLERRHAAMTK